MKANETQKMAIWTKAVAVEVVRISYLPDIFKDRAKRSEELREKRLLNNKQKTDAKQRTLSRINTKNITLRHIILNVQKVKGKENILKKTEERKKTFNL